MKYTVIISLFLLSLILTGCPSERENDAMFLSDLERLQKNNMDLPDMQRYNFEGIRYRMSGMFYYSSFNDFVLADAYEVKMNHELNLYFSIEKFTNAEAESIRYQFDEEDEISLLDAVHDNYAIKRNATLEEATISIKKAVPESVGFPGVIQTISGVNFKGIPANTYFMATLDIDNEIYVVQLIGREDNMGYLYDDFIDIISSISQ